MKPDSLNQCDACKRNRGTSQTEQRQVPGAGLLTLCLNLSDCKRHWPAND